MTEQNILTITQDYFDEKSISTESYYNDKIININNEHLALKKFNVNEIVNNPHILMIGKRGSGKTYTIINIINDLYKINKIDEIIIISPVEKHTNTYKKVFTNIKTFYHNYSAKLISQILKKQLILQKQKKSKKIMIIFDDCVGPEIWDQDKNLQEILYNGRHFNIGFILGMQFPGIIKESLISNFDYYFLFNDVYIPNIKRLYDNYYANRITSFDLFKNILLYTTQNYGSMIINTRTNDIKYFNAKHVYKCNINEFNIKYYSKINHNKHNNKNNLININNKLVNEIIELNKKLINQIIESNNNITKLTNIIMSNNNIKL
jgi:DNA polymerase III delta prime subunit